MSARYRRVQARAPGSVSAAAFSEEPDLRPVFALDYRLLGATAEQPAPDRGLVSCLCLTRGRYDHLRRTLRCFRAQSYPNLELVLVYEKLEPRAEELLDGADPRIRRVQIQAEPRFSQGARRNISLEASRGEYFCVWDDDDWHSPLRIERQVARLVEKDADFCMLGQMLVLDEPAWRVFLSSRRPWEPTLLCRKDLSTVGEGHPTTEHEDTPFVERLAERHRMTVLERPELFVYSYHGGNRCDRAHFETIFGYAAEASEDDLVRVTMALRSHDSALSPASSFPQPRKVSS
jgi:glycosyltransferase involved in cell wall biosynthesis